MNIKYLLVVLITFLVTSCAHMDHGATDNKYPEVRIKLDNTLNISLKNGVPVVLNDNGEVISTPVDLPDEIFPRGEDSSQPKKLVNVQELSIISISGSCVVYVKSGNQYVKVTLPNGHPLCS